MEVLTHIDNVSYTFLRKQKGKSLKINIDYDVLKATFHKYGEIKTPSGHHIGQFKYFDSKTGISYKIQGNVITVSLAKAIFRGYDQKINFYFHLARGLNMLFKMGILKKGKNKTTQHQCYYLLRTRGKVSVEHAIDIKGLDTSKSNVKIDSKGKRYQRKGFTRLEVITTNKDIIIPQLKEVRFLPSFMSEIIRLHTTNIMDKLSNSLISVIINAKIGNNRQNNANKIKAWLLKVITDNDISNTFSQFNMTTLINRERQNLI